MLSRLAAWTLLWLIQNSLGSCQYLSIFNDTLKYADDTFILYLFAIKTAYLRKHNILIKVIQKLSFLFCLKWSFPDYFPKINEIKFVKLRVLRVYVEECSYVGTVMFCSI